MFVWGLSSRERSCLQDRSCELRWKSYSATQELAFFGGRPLFFLGGSAGADASPSPSPPSVSAGASTVGLFFGGLPRLRFFGGSASSSARLYMGQFDDRVRATAIERYSDNEPWVDAL